MHERVAEVAAVSPGPAEETEIDQRKVFIRDVLRSLPPQHREIVVLRDYLDLSYAEIGKVLDIKAGPGWRYAKR